MSDARLKQIPGNILQPLTPDRRIFTSPYGKKHTWRETHRLM